MAIINPCSLQLHWAKGQDLSLTHAHAVLALMSTLAAAPQSCPVVLHGGELH